jgi:serine/threonine kinase PknH
MWAVFFKRLERKNMAKVFISYSRESEAVVAALAQDFKDDDHETWFDQRLTGGQKWWDKILSEIRDSEIFVASLTPDFLKSLACEREWKYALRLQKPVLPVRLSDKVQPVSLPRELGEREWVDYRPQDVIALKSLQRAVRNLPSRRRCPIHRPTRQRSRSPI